MSITPPGAPVTVARPETLEARLERLRRSQGWNQRPWVKCEHAHGSALAVKFGANGTRYLFNACVDCQQPYPASGGRWLSQDGVDMDQIPVVDDQRTQNPPCQVCGAWGTELHHWAPRAIFGVCECDHWPTAWLCVPCHAEWHKRIDEHR